MTLRVIAALGVKGQSVCKSSPVDPPLVLLQSQVVLHVTIPHKECIPDSNWRQLEVMNTCWECIPKSTFDLLQQNGKKSRHSICYGCVVGKK